MLVILHQYGEQLWQASASRHSTVDKVSVLLLSAGTVSRSSLPYRRMSVFVLVKQFLNQPEFFLVLIFPALLLLHQHCNFAGWDDTVTYIHLIIKETPLAVDRFANPVRSWHRPQPYWWFQPTWGGQNFDASYLIHVAFREYRGDVRPAVHDWQTTTWWQSPFHLVKNGSFPTPFIPTKHIHLFVKVPDDMFSSAP